jgi:hypothetical protein
MRSRTCYCVPAVALALVMFAALGAGAYQQALSPEAVREAYFLGRHNKRAREFLGRYQRTFPASPKTDMNITQVQVLTPYAQIVSASFHDMLNANAVDADQEYQNRSLPLLVNVWVYCPSASGYSAAPFEQCADAIRRSSFAVSQGHPFKPLKITYATLYSRWRNSSWPSGLEVELQFDDSQFQSAPMTISVSSPDGQHAEANFDLALLK